MKDLLTILIPTSPIPSHPSTEVIDEILSKLNEYEELRECKKIVMIDGVHPSLEHRRKAYEEYVSKLLEREDIFTISFGQHTHQATMTKRALEIVLTPFVLFCEHDTAPIGNIPFEKICLAMLNSYINYVRFHIFHEILPEHEYLMLQKIEIEGVPLRRTIQWSQRPHIASTDWYRDILNKYFQNGQKTMIEDVMHSIVQEDYKLTGKDNFYLSIYAPQGNMLRSYHSDGRGSDEKIITG